MNIRSTLLRGSSLALSFACFATPAVWAQDAREPLAVAAIQPLPSLAAAMARADKSSSLARVIEAYDSQLIDRLNAGRKFQIVGRSDLKQIIQEQELTGSGNVAGDDPNAAQAGRLAGVKYLLVATVDDFEDATDRMTFTNLNKVGLKRKIRLSTTARIYDSSTGKLMESMSVMVEKKDDRMDATDLSTNAEQTDVLLLETTHEAAERIATRLADRVFPVKVVVKRDRQITVNRGEGGGLEAGQLWNVFAIGEELIDPDTHESLGREEVLVGKARVISVLPKTSTAELLEDAGVDRGAVLRRAVE